MRKHTDVTELVFILDCSGSMGGLEEETISGYNNLLHQQRSKSGQVFVTTVFFNHEIKVVHSRIPIQEICPITREDYITGGCTALLDAVGGTISKVDSLQKAGGPKGQTSRVLIAIITDGYENSSQDFTYDQVKKLIQRQKTERDWQFIFLGANIDAVAEGERFGIDMDHSVKFMNDSEGVRRNFEAVSSLCMNIIEDCKLQSDWKKEIEEHEKQKK